MLQGNGELRWNFSSCSVRASEVGIFWGSVGRIWMTLVTPWHCSDIRSCCHSDLINYSSRTDSRLFISHVSCRRYTCFYLCPCVCICVCMCVCVCLHVRTFPRACTFVNVCYVHVHISYLSSRAKLCRSARAKSAREIRLRHGNRTQDCTWSSV